MGAEKKYSYDYPRPALTVDCMVFSKTNVNTEIVLIKRKHEPYKDRWAFPGGFVDMDETTDEAVRREVFEETGMEIDNFVQYKTFSAVDRDPRGRTVSVIYFVFVERKKIKFQAGDDASDASWFSIDKLPVLAFDHGEILNSFIEDILRKE